MRATPLLLLGIPGILTACARTGPPAVPPLAIEWTPFYPVAARTGIARFDHAGTLLLFQVRPTGPRSLVQLDLAGSGSMPHGFPRPRFELAPTRVRRGELYGLLGWEVTRRLTGAPDSLRDHWQEGEVGTLGLPYFLTRMLVLDFPGRRLATPPAEAWTTILGRAGTVVPLERGNREQVILPVTAASGRIFRGLLDTSLSPFAVWTTPAIWQDLTGLGGPGLGTRSYRLPNPGGRMVFVAAPFRGPLRIAGFPIEADEIVYLDQGPSEAALERWPARVDMVLGAAAFAQAVVAIDLANARVGLRAAF